MSELQEMPQAPAPGQQNMVHAVEPEEEPEYSSSCAGPCIGCVNAGNVGVWKSAGQFSGISPPGLVCYTPGYHTVEDTFIGAQIREMRASTRTKDNTTLTVVIAVEFRIMPNKVRQAVFEVEDPVSQLSGSVESALRSLIPTRSLNEVYSDRDFIVSGVLNAARADMSRYGYFIIKILITDILVEASVLMQLSKKKEQWLNKEATRFQAEADKIKDIKAAEADAEAKRLTGKGLADMRKAMANGFKESVSSVAATGVGTDKAMHMMVATQYLDTLKDFATSGKASIMVPTGPSGVMEIEKQVREGFMASESVVKK